MSCSDIKYIYTPSCVSLYFNNGITFDTPGRRMWRAVEKYVTTAAYNISNIRPIDPPKTLNELFNIKTS